MDKVEVIKNELRDGRRACDDMSNDAAAIEFELKMLETLRRVYDDN